MDALITFKDLGNAFAQKINLWQKEYFSMSLLNAKDNSGRITITITCREVAPRKENTCRRRS